MKQITTYRFELPFSKYPDERAISPARRPNVTHPAGQSRLDAPWRPAKFPQTFRSCHCTVWDRSRSRQGGYRWPQGSGACRPPHGRAGSLRGASGWGSTVQVAERSSRGLPLSRSHTPPLFLLQIREKVSVCPPARLRRGGVEFKFFSVLFWNAPAMDFPSVRINTKRVRHSYVV